MARLEHLGYADSGMGPQTVPDPPGRSRFVHAPIEEAAHALASILRAERADVLLSYDRHGGYGHRDHIRVHVVGARAAELAGTPRRLDATLPREPLRRMLELAATIRRLPPELDRTGFAHAWSARAEITHRVSVCRYAVQKRACLRAHSSQTAAEGGADRTLARLLRIPRPLYDLFLGREWFIDPCHDGLTARDVFAVLP